MFKRIVLCLAIYLLIIIPMNVFALDNDEIIVNSNGVEMTYEQYTNLRKYFGEIHIDVLTQEEFDEQMKLDFEHVNSTIKYYRTDYNRITGESISTEITEQEYMNAGQNDNNDMPRSAFNETNYKWLLIGANNLNGAGHFSLTAHWKIMPSTRSYDVIAVRFVDIDVVNGTQAGKQFYTVNGSSSYINYSWNGTNINNLSNGYGISMNLVDDTNLTGLELELSGSLEVHDYPAIIFGSYQHATSSVTLSESKNYTLGTGGMGNVIYFTNSSTAAKYDGMGGVDFYFFS